MLKLPQLSLSLSLSPPNSGDVKFFVITSSVEGDDLIT
jgi:hypothetical protein